jgi:hypothetical protein
VKHLFILLLITPILVFTQIIEDKSQNIPVVKKKLYTKGLVQFGGGYEKILAGQKSYIDSDKDPEDVYIRPGGGIGLEGIIGYDFSPSLSTEIGIGFAGSGETAGKDNLYFNKTIFRATILYKMASTKEYKPYIGGGFTTNLSAKYEFEEGGNEMVVKYKKPVGFHVLGGAIINMTPELFMFSDIKFIFLGKYKVEEAEFNGSTFPISNIENEFQEFGASGFQFTFGMGYYIN